MRPSSMAQAHQPDWGASHQGRPRSVSTLSLSLALPTCPHPATARLSLSLSLPLFISFQQSLTNAVSKSALISSASRPAQGETCLPWRKGDSQYSCTNWPLVLPDDYCQFSGYFLKNDFYLFSTLMTLIFSTSSGCWQVSANHLGILTARHEGACPPHLLATLTAQLTHGPGHVACWQDAGQAT